LVNHPFLRELYAGDISESDMLHVPPDDLRRSWRFPWRAVPWLRWVRARRPDAILLSYDQSSMAHLIARYSGAPYRMGARMNLGWRRSGLTTAVEWNGAAPLAEWHWAMARQIAADLGGGTLPSSPPPPDLSHLAGGVVRVARRIVFHAGSKRVMTRWPAGRFAELAGRLARSGHEVLWIEVPEATTALPDGVRGLQMGTLRDLARVLASAALFVGNNSGPMHVANALATPMVIVSGPAPHPWDPAWHRDRVRLLRRPELACQPCDKIDRLPPACTNVTEPLACLRRWEIEPVEAACLEMLARGESNGWSTS
jgi:ADP-heptose:LPS heptosyltransferase